MTTHHSPLIGGATVSPAPGRGRGRRRGLVAALVAAFAAAVTLASGGPASASTQGVWIGQDRLSVRDCYHPYKQPYPSQSCTYQATLENGLGVTLVCQTAGQGIGPQNDVYWDYVVYPATGGHGSGEGYVADWYVDTNVPNPPFRDWNVPLCSY
jgi:hypothetical protein